MDARKIPVTEMAPLRIGQTENRTAGTGLTVFLCPDGMRAGLDVRGGGPASRESGLLDPLTAAETIHAVVLGGGSAFGLDAAGGVMQLLEERGIGFDVGVTKVPLVVQSDLLQWAVRPPALPWRHRTTVTAISVPAAVRPSGRSAAWNAA